INFDGTAKGSLGLAVVGGIIRNDAGKMEAAHAEAIGNKSNNYVEAYAMLIGLKWVNTLHIKKLYVEGDSQYIINVMN
ncbi:hypothetical protein KI387_025183, partial [Taxus chinensis]